MPCDLQVNRSALSNVSKIYSGSLTIAVSPAVWKPWTATRHINPPHPLPMQYYVQRMSHPMKTCVACHDCAMESAAWLAPSVEVRRGSRWGLTWEPFWLLRERVTNGGLLKLSPKLGTILEPTFR